MYLYKPRSTPWKCHWHIKNVITIATNDFIKRANVINAQFRSVFNSTTYKLFKTFCRPMYGYELWDFFYVAWRKSVRLLLYGPVHT